jgi:ketosteroid isomerase-like protein
MQSPIFETNHGELISLEKQYWAALQHGDLPSALHLTGFPCVVTDAHGVRIIDQPTYEKNFREMPFTIDHVELSEIDVQFPSKDVAVVSYLVVQELSADGDHQQHRCASTSTWLRHQTGWKCVQHAEVPLRDTIH